MLDRVQSITSALEVLALAGHHLTLGLANLLLESGLLDVKSQEVSARIGTVCDAETAMLPFGQLALYPLGSVIPLTVKTESPTFVMVKVASLVVPTSTFPKAKPSLSAITGVGVVAGGAVGAEGESLLQAGRHTERANVTRTRRT